MENMQLLSRSLSMLRDVLRAKNYDVTNAQIELDTHDNQYEEKSYRIKATAGSFSDEAEHTVSHIEAIHALIVRIQASEGA